MFKDHITGYSSLRKITCHSDIDMLEHHAVPQLPNDTCLTQIDSRLHCASNVRQTAS